MAAPRSSRSDQRAGDGAVDVNDTARQTPPPEAPTPRAGRSDDTPTDSLLTRMRDRIGLSRQDDPGETDTIYTTAPNDRPGWHVRLFGSHEFFRLWLVQVISATGDWLGLTATIAFANQLFEGDPGAAAAAISLVVSVRLLPHLFFSPVAGVLVDRWDRKKVMVAADLSRASILLVLPLVKSLWGLMLFSLLLEMFTLLWTPAKEAITPDLVPHDHLTTANSLNLAAGYGTAPIATLIFAALAGLSAFLGSFSALSFLSLNQTALAFYADSATFVVSAFMVWRLAIPERSRRRHTPRPAGERRRVDLAQAFHDLKEGWQYVFINPTVRAVNLSLAVALIGGGMLIPLGAVFSSDVLGAGAAGFGLFTSALMFGVAAGVIGVSALQKRLPKQTVFPIALFVAGAALFLGASLNSLPVAATFVFAMGAAVGPAYVLGYSILHEQVDDDLRGRVFAALNTLVRFCVFLALILGPLMATFLDSVVRAVSENRSLAAGDYSYFVPGVRLTLWLDALIIMGAGVMAWKSLHESHKRRTTAPANHPSGTVTGGRVPLSSAEHAASSGDGDVVEPVGDPVTGRDVGPPDGRDVGPADGAGTAP